MTAVQIALAFDTPFLRQSMVAMLSVLENAKRPVSVHILGDELSAAAKKVIEDGCKRNGAADLVFHDLEHVLENVLPRERRLGWWTRVILARLFIPKLIDGRVLYLDGDTCAFADISPLFEMDMGGSLLGCVRDTGALAAFEKTTDFDRRLTRHHEDLMSPFPRHDYFNSGVLLFDCDGIRNDEAVFSSIARIEDLEKYGAPDQDHLNVVFRNRTLFLHPSWNSFYGLQRKAVRVSNRILPPEMVQCVEKTRIIHYILGPKPWMPFEARWLPRTSFMVRRLPTYLQYRFTAKRLLAPYKAAVD